MNEVQRMNDFRKIAPPLITDNQFFMDWLIDNGFFSAPASIRFHGAYNGGLYDHSKNVYIHLQEMTDKLGLSWMRPESPFVVGMFHDLCKIDQYREIVDEPGKTMFGEFEPQGRETHFERANPLLTGHANKSILLLSFLMRLTEEEMLCIRFHMGAFESGDSDGFGNVIKRFPNVLYAHTADMLAAKVMEV